VKLANLRRFIVPHLVGRRVGKLWATQYGGHRQLCLGIVGIMGIVPFF
jgi:hypothetical protein